MKTHRTRKVDEKTHYENTSCKSDMKKMRVEVYECSIKDEKNERKSDSVVTNNDILRIGGYRLVITT